MLQARFSPIELGHKIDQLPGYEILDFERSTHNAYLLVIWEYSWVNR